MLHLQHVFVLAISLSQVTSAVQSQRRQHDESVVQPLNATELEDSRWPITAAFINRNSSGDSDLSGLNTNTPHLPPDPFETEDKSHEVHYGYRFYDYRGELETTAVANGVFWSQWTVQSKLLQNARRLAIGMATPYVDGLDWERDGVHIGVPSHWRQGQELTYGDIHSIISTIWEFTDYWLAMGEPTMKMCSILVTKNPSAFGAQTMWLKFEASRIRDEGPGLGVGGAMNVTEMRRGMSDQ